MEKESADRHWRKLVSYWLCLAVSVCSFILLTPKVLIAADTTVGVQVCNTAVGAPTLTSPAADATTQDSSIILSGTGDPSTTIYAFRNSVQVGYVTSAGDGSFSISVPLVVGSNVLKVAVLDECSQYVDSATVTITREAIPTPPSPPPSSGSGSGTSSGDGSSSTGGSSQSSGSGGGSSTTTNDTTDKSGGNAPLITLPRDGDKFSHRYIVITGTASPLTNVKIYLNGRLVAEVLSDDKGQFSASVFLIEGDNEIVVTTGSGKNLRKSAAVTIAYRRDFLTILSTGWTWLWLMIVLTFTTFLFLLFFIIRRRKKKNEDTDAR